jgi:transcriptional regulator with XRE-family HTH domain
MRLSMNARPCPAGWLSQAAIATFIVVACQAGTGGEQTENFYRARGVRGYSFARFNSPNSERLNRERTAAENITHIRDAMKSSVTELASVFGVSRQAIYDWQSGKPIAQENLDKLDDFAKAADMILADTLLQSTRSLRRRIPGGKTVFEMVRDGGSAQEAVRVLASMLHREADQRSAMQARLASRSMPNLQPSDLGVPTLREG